MLRTKPQRTFQGTIQFEIPVNGRMFVTSSVAGSRYASLDPEPDQRVARKTGWPSIL
jgi:hypothetical protein